MVSRVYMYTDDDLGGVLLAADCQASKKTPRTRDPDLHAEPENPKIPPSEGLAARAGEMIAPSEFPRRAASLIATTAQPQLDERQVVITQTLTYPSSTVTAFVTLGNSGTPTTSAPPVSGDGSISDSSSSGGLSQAQVGIIVGCLVGGVVLIIVAWCCVAKCRQNRAGSDSDSTSYDSYTSSYITEIYEPRSTAWPAWRSIPPPVVPIYRARPPGPAWTANARASTTYVRR